MKPKYEQMSFSQLRDYVLKNRDDIEALRFFMSKRNPHSRKYPMPKTEDDIRSQTEIIQRKISNS